KTLTATDIKTSFESAIRLTGSAMPAAFAPIQGVPEFLNGASEVSGIVIVSENIIEIHLSEAIPIYPAMLTDPWTGIALESEKDAPPVGTGPFQISSFEPNRIVLKRNLDYWKGSPLPDAVEFRTNLSAAEMAAGLRSGEIDLARDLLPEDLDEI